MHPILFQLGPLGVYSYGASIALGGVLSCLFWRPRRERMGLRSEDDFWLLVNVLLFSAFIGGRLLFLAEYTRPFSREFWTSLVSLSRGFSIMGAFLGVTTGLWWLSRRLATPLPRLLDYVCVPMPLWHAFGRLGCFMAGCCFGRPSDLSWAVTFRDPRSMVAPALLGRPLHPAQLYEAVGDLLIAGVLYYWVLPAVERSRQPRGTVVAAYFLAYATLRFITEFFRGDVVRMPGLGMTAAQGLSVLMALAAIGIYLYVRRRAQACTRP